MRLLKLQLSCQYLPLSIYRIHNKYGFSITIIKDVFGSILDSSNEKVLDALRFDLAIKKFEIQWLHHRLIGKWKTPITSETKT